MENLPELAGRLFPVLLFACLALYFFVRGLERGPRSRRLANLALFCGLTAFVVPEIALRFSPAGNSGLFLASGVTRLVIGVIGIAIATVALWCRNDGGVSVVRPVVGGGFSLLHVIVGAGFVMFSSYAWASTPWVFQAADGTFRLTLPSRQWRQVAETDPEGVVAFVRPLPRMQARVLAVRQQQTEDDFAQAVAALNARLKNSRTLREQPQVRGGTKESGDLFRYLTLVDTTPDGNPVFVGYSVTWCLQKQTVVEVVVEGLPRMLSETGKAAEMEHFQKAAEIICLSVE